LRGNKATKATLFSNNPKKIFFDKDRHISNYRSYSKILLPLLPYLPKNRCITAFLQGNTLIFFDALLLPYVALNKKFRRLFSSQRN